MSKAKTDINIVPLIDIVLVLLIVFIIMVPGMMKSLPTVIPEIRKDITPPVIDEKNPPLVLEVVPSENKDEYSYSINQTPLWLEDIPKQLPEWIGLQPAGEGITRKVFLSVDRDVPYKEMVKVMDQLKLAFKKVIEDDSTVRGFLDDVGEPKIIVRPKKRPGE